VTRCADAYFFFGTLTLIVFLDFGLAHAEPHGDCSYIFRLHHDGAAKRRQLQ
jgi:hypothetical protein